MTTPAQEAWKTLRAVAVAFAGEPEGEAAQKTLSDAAVAYAEARRAATPVSVVYDARTDAHLTLPFGRSKGQPIRSAATGDLKWILPIIRESVDAPDKARWRDANVALARAIEAELGRR